MGIPLQLAVAGLLAGGVAGCGTQQTSTAPDADSQIEDADADGHVDLDAFDGPSARHPDASRPADAADLPDVDASSCRRDASGNTEGLCCLAQSDCEPNDVPLYCSIEPPLGVCAYCGPQ